MAKLRHTIARPLLAEADWVRALRAPPHGERARGRRPRARDALAGQPSCGPPPEDRPLRGWLGGVLRNLVREERRAASPSRRARALVAREEAVASGAELLERLDSHRSVVEAVARLAEPYRTAILLRYFEGLSPARSPGAPGRRPARAHALFTAPWRGCARTSTAPTAAIDGRGSWP
jgi:hypothetical protein